MRDQIATAVRIGDNLQSAAERVRVHLRDRLGTARDPEITYEVLMALGEIESLVEEWTELRRGRSRGYSVVRRCV